MTRVCTCCGLWPHEWWCGQEEPPEPEPTDIDDEAAA